jgi:RNA polymerase sigma factor for flagellar operon FliA
MSSFAERMVERVWSRYRRTRAVCLRNFLIEHFLPLVEKQAQRLKAKLPALVQVEDLVSVGVLGLMDALETFDPSKNVKFSTYSSRRIWGAMVDELRSGDWVPRLVRTQAKRLESARAHLRQELGREAEEEEVRRRLQLTPAQFRRYLAGANPVQQVPMSVAMDENDSESYSPLQLADHRATDPSRAAQHRAVREMLTRGLSRAERLVVLLYYYENLTLNEIGDALDLSESRISQMHKSILRRLKARTDFREDLREAAVA